MQRYRCMWAQCHPWRTWPTNELDNIEWLQDNIEDAKMSISSSQKTLGVKGSWILFYRHWEVV